MRRILILQIFSLLILIILLVISFSYLQIVKNDVILSCSQRNYWNGKNILWLGTSIPAGTANNNYPVIVGKLLNANVVNNSLGTSSMRSGSSWNNSLKDQEDVLGIKNLDWRIAVYSFSQSVEEKQNIIKEWEYKWGNKDSLYQLYDAPAKLSEEEKDIIIGSSYENKLLPYLNGTFPMPDLFVIDHGYNDYYGNDDIKTFPADPYDREYFIGAVNRFIKTILEVNPKAKIVIIGHYEDDTRPGVTEAQEIISDYWNIPILKLWEVSGFSNNAISINNEKRIIKEIYMPDGLHPSSDETGKTNEYIAGIISTWLRNIY